MAESVEIKCSHVSGVLSRYRRVTFGLCKKEFKMMFLFRKIRNTILRHAEFVLASNVTETLPHGGQAHKAHTSPVRFVKRVQGDIEIVYKPCCHSELGSESCKHSSNK